MWGKYERFVHNDARDVPQGLICRQTGHKSIIWMSNIQDQNEGAYLCLDIQYKNQKQTAKMDFSRRCIDHASLKENFGEDEDWLSIPLSFTILPVLQYKYRYRVLSYLILVFTSTPQTQNTLLSLCK